MRVSHNIDMKMPSESTVLPLQTEKPQHYTYLKEFRTQQCPLFLQHKCTQHRPYTCFNWHFMNQRRRRPIRKRDGTFSYSPDVYCSKYDENSGLCPDGDECPYLHRTGGDTERRYHLRYYKTGTCVHETDPRGNCVKNGAHCAFAHGSHDLRPPVYDARERHLMEQAEKVGDPTMLGSLAIASGIVADNNTVKQGAADDPKWNVTEYVLQNYKTEQCKKLPRSCRQGYACPCFHNNRDRRRCPRTHKYRSTPCPNVKHGDEWGDPVTCDSGDACSYCHTRTEQQFHPEIYKSTKCNDMVQTGYCPRGAFCAFAHVEHEMSGPRDMTGSLNSSFGAYLPNALHSETVTANSQTNDFQFVKESNNNNNKLPHPIGKERTNSTSSGSSIPMSMTGSYSQTQTLAGSYSQSQPLPEPIGKGRSSSTSSSISDVSSVGIYPRAPGSEREDSQFQNKLRQQLQAIDSETGLTGGERSKLQQQYSLASTNGRGSTSSPSTTPVSTVMSPLARPFFPPGDTVESVVGNALDESQLTLNFDLGALSIEADGDNDTNSVSSSLSAGFSSSAGFSGTATSNPVSIPCSETPRSTVGSLSQSPPSPMSSLSAVLAPSKQKQEVQLEQAQAAFLSQPNPGLYAAPSYSDFNSASPQANTSGSQSPLFNSSNGTYGSEVQRLRDELAVNKSKLASWEEGIAQARSACEAWKTEAEEATRKVKLAEESRNQAIRTRDEALVQLSKLKVEVGRLSAGPFLKCLQTNAELELLSLSQLKYLQQQLRNDLEKLDELVYQCSAMKCLLCQERNRSVAVMPCNHCVLCDNCALNCRQCPYCRGPITHKSSVVLPL